MALSVEPFQQALDTFRNKIILTPDEVADIEASISARVFTSKRIAEADILQDFSLAIEQSLAQGTTFNKFRDTLVDTLDRLGWTGSTPYREAVIYRTQIQSMYNAGHYQSQTEPEVLQALPLWRYIATLDNRTRPDHARMHNTVLPANDPWWDVNYPPNGYNCRCTVVAVNQRIAEQRGLSVPKQRPDNIADKGFEFNPGKAAYDVDLGKYPKWLQDRLRESRG